MSTAFSQIQRVAAERKKTRAELTDDFSAVAMGLGSFCLAILTGPEFFASAEDAMFRNGVGIL